MKKLILFTLFLMASNLILANNLTITNSSLQANPNNGWVYVQFDISWENSWRTSTGAANWDAAWVFIKYRVGSGDWQHAKLSPSPSDHIMPTGASIYPSSDSLGVFIYRSTDGTGTVNFSTVKLAWKTTSYGIAEGATIDFNVMGIEMVYVSPGNFWLGDACSYFPFRQSGSNSSVQISSTATTVKQDGSNSNAGDAILEAGINVDGDNGICTTGTGTIDNADYPTGYNAFYCMKYEISQGQYTTFLNFLTATQAGLRYPGYNGQYRYNISGTYPNYSTTTPEIPCNFLSWADDAAYADWSGLRPMSELEFEKACRGTANASSGEYAWGNINLFIWNYTLTNSGTANEGISDCGTNTGNAAWDDKTGGPLRCGIFAASAVNKTRQETGATFYGIMEMSGNLYERTVSLGNSTGRGFTSANGNGKLNASGDADVISWPGTNAVGTGLRGGSWYNYPGWFLWVSYRSLAASAYTDRTSLYGFRCVRSIPSVLAPTITTSAISNIVVTSATGGGNITSDGGSTVTARGVCWSTSPNPTISNSKTSDGTGSGAFTSSITGLIANTLYYVRAYATNSAGTAYGDEVSFTIITENWAKTIGGATNDYPGSIAFDSNGNLFLAGSFTGTVDFQPGIGIDNKTSNGGSDIFLSKFDVNGNYLWTKSFGGTGNEFEYPGNPNMLAVDNSNNIFIASYFTGTVDFDPSTGVDNRTSNGLTDVCLIKINADGSYGWTKVFGGSGSGEFAQTCAVDNSGNLYIGGSLGGSSSIDFDPGAGEDLASGWGGGSPYIWKINSDGSYGWKKIFSMSTAGYGQANALRFDPSQNLFIAGGFEYTVDFDPGAGTDYKSSGGYTDMFFSKINSDNSYGGTKTIGSGAGVNNQQVLDLFIKTDGVQYYTGSIQKYSGSGSVDMDFTSGTDIINPVNIGDFYITKLTNESTYAWTKLWTGTGQSGGISITKNTNGDYFIAGFFAGTMDFDPGVSVDSKTASGTHDIFVIKFNADDSYAWTKTFGGVGVECFYPCVRVNGNYTYLTGGFTGTIDLDPSTGVLQKTSNGGPDIFLVKLDNDGNLVQNTTNICNTTTPLNTARTQHSSVAYNGYLYILGGRDDTNYLNDVRYASINSDGSIGSWQITSSFTTARSQPSSLVYNGYIYIIGGSGVGGVPLNNVQYAPINPDGSLGAWQNTTSFPNPRWSHTSVVHNGYLYVIQGFDYSAASPRSDIQYAPINPNGTIGTWQSTTSFSPARWVHNSVVYNGYIYNIGGVNWNGNYYTLGDVQYTQINGNGTLNTWQATTPFNQSICAVGMAAYDGCIFVTGGGNIPNGSNNDIKYATINADKSLGTWQSLTTFNKARTYHTSLVYNGYLYIIGGQDANNNDIALNDVQYFNLNNLPVVTDVDGNTYNTVTIGTQIWMKENLKTTHYSNGDIIPFATNNTDWTALTYADKAFCWYNDQVSNKNIYGALYTWPAAMNGKTSSSLNPSGVEGVCPTGWHLPSTAEWTVLTDYLGGESVAGGKLKEVGSSHWSSVNAGATNEYGFTALPGGSREANGVSSYLGNSGVWWTSTEGAVNWALGRGIDYSDIIVRVGGSDKNIGFSVRCLKD